MFDEDVAFCVGWKGRVGCRLLELFELRKQENLGEPGVVFSLSEVYMSMLEYKYLGIYTD